MFIHVASGVNRPLLIHQSCDRTYDNYRWISDIVVHKCRTVCGSVGEWLACWTQVQ